MLRLLAVEVLESALAFVSTAVFDREIQALEKRGSFKITHGEIAKRHAAQSFVRLCADHGSSGGIAEENLWAAACLGVGLDDNDAFGHLIEGYSEEVVGRLHLIEAGL